MRWVCSVLTLALFCVPVCSVLAQDDAMLDDSFLDELSLTKGTMNLVDSDRQKEILTKSEQKEKTTTLGGSCANTLVMIAQLGGKTAFGGKVGDDNLADD